MKGKATAIVVAVAIALLLGWEGYALYNSKDAIDPITTVIRLWNSGSGGLLALLFGLLMGHFFWCPCKKIDARDVARRAYLALVDRQCIKAQGDPRQIVDAIAESIEAAQ